MPEAGDFNKDQHDQETLANWAGTFAALPQETPPADGWQRVQARLPAVAVPARQRRRWPLWLASAASLALVNAIPLRMQSTTTSTTTTTNAGPTVTTESPSHGAVMTQPMTDAGTEVASVDITPASTEDTDNTTSTSLPAPATIARVRKPSRDRYVDPSQRPIRTAAQPADTTRIASFKTTDAPATGTYQDSLESLHAQSVQLEDLLALARDERVSTGTAAVLTDALTGQMADIDAALAQSEASPQARNDLWRNRVDTLRQLVGIETTQRLYSARGQRSEAALVSID